MLPKSAHTMRGLGAPGAGLGAGLKKRRDPNPRGRSPLCIVGFYDNGGEVLLKREPTGSPGVRGNPGGVLLPFSAVGKRKWPRIGQFFARIAFFMRGQTMKPFFYMRSCRAAPPFLTSRKGGKKRQGAKPPEPPGGFVDFLSMKIDYDHVA